MTDSTDAQQLGRHEADIANLKTLVGAMAEDVHAMRKAMDEMRGWKNEMRGGMKVAIWASGAFGSAVTLVISHFWGGKP